MELFLQFIHMFFGRILTKAAWVLIFTLPTIFCYFWIGYKAFRKNFWIGTVVTLPLFIPMMIFVIKNWKETRAPFVTMLACGSVFFAMIFHYQNQDVHIQPEIKTIEKLNDSNQN